MDQNQYQTDNGLVRRNPAATGSAAVEEAHEIDLLMLFNALKKRILIIIAVALVFALGAGGYVQLFVTPLYTATTSTYLVSASTGLSGLLTTTDLAISNNIIGDYADIIKSRTVLNAVIEQMELPYSYGTLYSKISITNPSETHIIKITVTDPDPIMARDIANHLTHYAVDQLAEIMQISTPNVYDEAITPSRPASPNLTRSVMAAFIMGAVLAAGIIVFIAVMDTTVKTAEDIENRCGMVTLTKVYYEGGRKKKGYGYGYGGYAASVPAKSGKSEKSAKSGGAKK